MLRLGLLALGAHLGLPAGCGALGGRPPRTAADGTLALQVEVQQHEGEGALSWAPAAAAASVELSFKLTGIDYASLSASATAVASLKAKVADSVCAAHFLPVADCHVTLSASPGGRHASAAFPPGDWAPATFPAPPGGSHDLSGPLPSSGTLPTPHGGDPTPTIEMPPGLAPPPGSPSPAASATLPSSGGATPTLQAPSAAASATLQAPSGGGTPTLQAPPTLSAGDAAGTAQVVGGAVLVDVIVSQLQDPVSAEAEFSANMDMIKSSLLLSTIADAEIMAHESGDAMRVEDVVVSQASNDLASAVGDPHLRSVTGKKFDVNMPGSYVLLRAPQDRRLPARLELNATLRPSAGSPCGLYIKSLELGGEWLGGQEVSIVPLQRDAEGQNGAGNSTLHPFSVRVRAHPGAPDAAQGEYEQWADFRKEGRSLSGRVRLVPVWRQLYADAGRIQEAQAFQFQIRGEGAEYGATLEAAQAAHQALDVQAAGLRSLGFESLGGLIGTEDHDGSVENLSDECKAFRAKTRQSRPMPAGSSIAASWDAPR